MHESAPGGSRSLDEQSPGLVLDSFCLCFLLCPSIALFDQRLEFRPLTHTLRLVQRPLFSFATVILLGAVAREKADTPSVSISLPADCTADSVSIRQGEFFKLLEFWPLLGSKEKGQAAWSGVSIIPWWAWWMVLRSRRWRQTVRQEVRHATLRRSTCILGELLSSYAGGAESKETDKEDGLSEEVRWRAGVLVSDMA